MASSRSGIAAVFALLALWLLWAAPARAESPNFIHIMTDDQTVDSLRHMPHTERLLARRGTTFSNYHATQPLCCPSRTSFLTGTYPHNHGVLNNLSPYGYGAVDFSRTLYTAMQDAGYRTGWIGKIINAVGGQGIEPEPGFDEWLVPLDSSQVDMFDFAISDSGVRREITGTYQTELYEERAESFLAAAGERPFLLTVSPFSPHWVDCPPGEARRRCAPTPAPQDVGSFRGERFPFDPELSVKHELRVRANRWWRRELESLQSVDRLVATLVRELRRSGELQNTYVIFQSDNGWEHGEHHGMFEKNLPWDRVVRVPLIIRGPELARGATRDDLTANVDVPATILDAAGVDPPVPADGYSLLGPNRRRHLLLERLVGRGKRATSPWQQIKSASGWSYWWYPRSDRQRLFDLRSDPAQLHNQVQRKPLVLERMRRRLAQYATCANPCP